LASRRLLWTALVVAIALPVLHQTIPHAGLHHALGIGGDGVAEAHSEHHLSSLTVSPAVYKAPGGQSECPANRTNMIDDSFPEPEYLFSQNGVLDVSLTAARQPTEINGKTYLTSSYNGQFPAPTWVACPGDTINVHVQNDLVASNYTGEHAGETNLHTHGFHVSPHVPGDNVFRTILPGDDFQYQYNLPLDHPPGAYWFHPHLHGQTNNQVFGGMAGAIIIQGGLDSDPDYADIPTRDLVIQQTALGNGVTEPPPGGAAAQLFLNGHLNPQIPIAPGELQRWRIYNASSGQFVKLLLTGGSFSLLARDGNYVDKRQRQQVVTIGPSSRREVLVRGGSPGNYELLSLPYQQTPSALSPQQTLATIVSQGAAVDTPRPPRGVANLEDLRDDHVNKFHKLVYSQDPPNFYINGLQFDPDVVNQTMKLDKVEQWKIENTTTFWHTFHMHINDFQLTKINDHRVHGINYDDNVSIPPGGSVTLRTRPTDFTGKFVFHCHVLGHEDNGMMGVVRVKP
jgi:FtsP/CotA-like multicopper oxidase with cupredoxin domain